MFALFIFSFIFLYLLLPHKIDLRLKACISTLFLFFSISHFSSKKSLSLFPVNTLKNIATSEFFTYEPIKASNFASMVCFNWKLNLFFIFFFSFSGTGIIRLTLNWYYNLLWILVLTQDLLMVSRSTTTISGLF